MVFIAISQPDSYDKNQQRGIQMQFKDEGYIAAIRRYGENSLIVNVITKEHGLIGGFVKGGGSKKNAGIYQPGNRIFVDAYARIEENMLSLKTELLAPTAVSFMNSPAKLAALSSLCSLCAACLPEKENLERFYYYIESFFDLVDEENWLTHYCFFEFYLLEYLGIGLDLSECAVTGSRENLAYVSPKSGRAVCREFGAPYAARLYRYPHFIVDKNYFPNRGEMADLLKMSGFFLTKNFFQIHGLKFPQNRANLLANLDL